jgi:hypothetical protein
MLIAGKKLFQNLEKRAGDGHASHRGGWADYPDGLGPGYQRLFSLASGTRELQGPMGEFRHALLCGCQHSHHDPQQCIAAPYPGYLLCQDTCLVANVKGLGEIKGLGDLYLQSVVDAHSSLAFAKLYRAGSSIAAVNILQDRVLPFYAQQGVKIERMLTDDGKEYGRKFEVRDLYEAFLIHEGIEHVRGDSLPAAADNPVCAQFHGILDEEFFVPALRKHFYLHLDSLQSDLDAYLKHYNCERACPGLRTQGQTPYRAFLDALQARCIGCGQ